VITAKRRENSRAFPCCFMLPSDQKLQTTRKITSVLHVHVHPPSFSPRLEWLPRPCAAPQPLCSAHSFRGAPPNAPNFQVCAFNCGYFCCPAKTRNFQISSHRKTTYSISCCRRFQRVGTPVIICLRASQNGKKLCVNTWAGRRQTRQMLH